MVVRIVAKQRPAYPVESLDLKKTVLFAEKMRLWQDPKPQTTNMFQKVPCVTRKRMRQDPRPQKPDISQKA